MYLLSAFNKRSDLSKYPRIASLTNDKLTKSQTVNNNSLDKDADTLNEQCIKQTFKHVVRREENLAQAAEKVLTIVNSETAEDTKETMAKQLADFPTDEAKGPEPQFPDEGIFALEDENRWQLFFDGVADKRGNGIGILLVDPKDEHTQISIKLNFEVTNNAAKYEACATGLEVALE